MRKQILDITLGTIKCKLATDYPMSKQEMIDTKQDLESLAIDIQVDIVDFDMKGYIAHSTARINKYGDYISLNDIRQELASIGYRIEDSKDIYSGDILVAKFNMHSNWVILSRKLIQYPEGVIYSFPSYFKLWWKDYYTTIGTVRKQLVNNVYDIDINIFTKGVRI